MNRVVRACLLALALPLPVLAQHPGHAAQEQDDPHAGHAMPAQDADPHAGHVMPAAEAPRTPIPPVTAADRAAAFPDVGGHAVHDRHPHVFLLLDRLEAWEDGSDTTVGWEALAWYGTDLDRLWLRSEGEADGDRVEDAELEAFYGRAVAPWWDALVGVRHATGEGPSRTDLAFGVIGLAPMHVEVAATGYVGSDGHVSAALEAEYEMLLTNRLVLQWLGEIEWHAAGLPEHRIGSGVATTEAGLRLRYEFTRKFAPYVGIAWERVHGATGRLRRAAGEHTEDTRVVVGIRTWF